jgi:hypothetical protein
MIPEILPKSNLSIFKKIFFEFPTIPIKVKGIKVMA